jgi:hypothetical protein
VSGTHRAPAGGAGAVRFLADPFSVCCDFHPVQSMSVQMITCILAVSPYTPTALLLHRGCKPAVGPEIVTC